VRHDQSESSGGDCADTSRSERPVGLPATLTKANKRHVARKAYDRAMVLMQKGEFCGL